MRVCEQLTQTKNDRQKTRLDIGSNQKQHAPILSHTVLCYRAGARWTGQPAKALIDRRMSKGEG